MYVFKFNAMSNFLCIFPKALLHVLSPRPTRSIIFGDLQIVSTLFVCFSTKPLCALWPLGWQPTASVSQRHPRRSGILHDRRPRQYGQRPPVSLLQSGPEPGAPAEVQGGGDEGPGWQRLHGLVGLKNRKRKRKKMKKKKVQEVRESVQQQLPIVWVNVYS